MGIHERLNHRYRQDEIERILEIVVAGGKIAAETEAEKE